MNGGREAPSFHNLVCGLSSQARNLLDDNV